MWFPRRQILVELCLQHFGTFTNTKPKVYCKSGQEPVILSTVDGDLQKISIEIEAPDRVLVDATHTGSDWYTAHKISIDGVEVNADNVHNVFKIATNKGKLPVSLDNVESYHLKGCTGGDRIPKNAYLLFDIYETDFITYLLSIGNKMIW